MNTGDSAPQINPRAALALVHRARREASVRNHLRKVRLWREPTNALHEVLIRLAVAGEDGPQQGDDGERVLVVQPRAGANKPQRIQARLAAVVR